MTLVELMVAAGLLLVLVGVLLSILMPVIQRAEHEDRKFTHIQQTVFLRQYLGQRLENAVLLAADEGSLTYYLPRRGATAMGTLQLVGPAELVDWDPSRRYSLHAEDGDIVEDEIGQPAARKRLWRLGEGGTLRLDAARPPAIRVEVSGRHQDGTPWSKAFTLIAPRTQWAFGDGS